MTPTLPETEGDSLAATLAPALGYVRLPVRALAGVLPSAILYGCSVHLRPALCLLRRLRARRSHFQPVRGLDPLHTAAPPADLFQITRHPCPNSIYPTILFPAFDPIPLKVSAMKQWCSELCEWRPSRETSLLTPALAALCGSAALGHYASSSSPTHAVLPSASARQIARLL